MRYHKGLMTVTCVLLLGVLCLPLFAQESADICIANGIVARIRDKGPYSSVEERASAIDKAIVEVISGYDTERPQVSLKQKDGIWTVYCWDLPVMGVYPAEAEANNLPAKQLGALWVENFRKRLPLATPLSKMKNPPKAAPPADTPTAAPQAEPIQPAPAQTPDPAPQPGAAEPATEPVTEPATEPATEPTGEPAAEPAATPASATDSTPTEPAAPIEPAKTPAVAPLSDNAPLLLAIDALRISRTLTEDEWIDQREQLARNLLENLDRLSGGKPLASIQPAATAPITPASPAQPPATVTPPKPAATEPVAGPPAPAATAVTPAPPVPSGDPSYARVPQKQRIGRKFEAARTPFIALQNESPEQASAVNEVLKRARKYFAVEEFDLCEQHLDQALTVLGVDPTTIN